MATFIQGTGVAGPAPNCIIEIKSVGDKTENLWDKSKSTTDWVNSTGGITQYPDGKAQTSDYIPCKPNTTYTIRGYISSYTYNQLEIAYFDGNKQWISRDSVNANWILSATTPSNAVYIRCGCYRGDDTTVINQDIICVEGSTAPTEYIPYGYKIPVKVSPLRLPAEYQEVEYLKSTGEQYIDTNIKPNSNTKITAGPDVVQSSTTNIYLSQPLRSIGESHGLPAEYQEVDYLAGTGTQYIRTGINPNNYNKFKVVTAVNPTLGNATYYGANYGYWFGTSTNNKFTIGGGINSTVPVDGTFKNITFETVKETETHAEISLKIDTETIIRNYDIPSSPSQRATDYYIMYISDFTQGTFKGSSKAVEIYGDDELIGLFVPCKRISDNVLGMYDIITKTFFTNAGTGTFTSGTPVYSDYINYEAQKVVRNIGKDIFTGVETGWSYSVHDTSGQRRVYTTLITGHSGEVGLCTHLKQILTSTSYPDEGYFSFSSASTIIGVGNNISSVGDWKAYLAAQARAGTPLTFYYPLATPTEETITLPQLSAPLGNSVVTVDTKVQPNASAGIQIQGEV